MQVPRSGCRKGENIQIETEEHPRLGRMLDALRAGYGSVMQPQASEYCGRLQRLRRGSGHPRRQRLYEISRNSRA
jgi:hypothetical protein